MKKKQSAIQSETSFTLTELLTVTAIISVLAAILLPVLSIARERAKYARWVAYKNNLSCDTSLAAYYTFEKGEGTKLENRAFGDTMNFIRHDPEETHGTIIGATWVKDGGRWQGKNTLEFDEIDDYVDCGNDVSLDISESWTISLWVRQNGTGTYQTLFNKEGPRCTYSAWVYRDRLYFGMRSGGTWHQDSSMGSIPENIWTFVAVTFDGTDAKAYINGKYTDILHVGGVGDTTDANLYLGRRNRNGSLQQELCGCLDEFEIYNRTLSASEIKGHYKMGRP